MFQKILPSFNVDDLKALWRLLVQKFCCNQSSSYGKITSIQKSKSKAGSKKIEEHMNNLIRKIFGSRKKQIKELLIIGCLKSKRKKFFQVNCNFRLSKKIKHHEFSNFCNSLGSQLDQVRPMMVYTGISICDYSIDDCERRFLKLFKKFTIHQPTFV